MPQSADDKSIELDAAAHGNRAAAAKNVPTIAAEIVGMACSAIGGSVPGLAAVAKFIEMYGERTLERGRQILLEEISKGRIDSISNEVRENLFGCSYRYFEAVRRGEYEHNLRILGEYIKNGILRDQLVSAEFSYDARMIESLSKFEISILSHCGRLSNMYPEFGYMNGKALFLCSNQLKVEFSHLSRVENLEIKTALSVLASRGIITPDGTSSFDKGEEYYLPNANLKRLIIQSSSAFNEFANA